MLTTLPHDTETPDIETSSPEYRSRFSGEVGSFFLECQSHSVLRLIDSLTGAKAQPAEMTGNNASQPLRILEVGGGHAQVTRELLSQGYNVVVQGSSAACSRYLQEESEWQSSRLEFVASSLWNLPFPDQTFDVVIALRVMAHVKRSQELIAEMCRVAKQGVIIDYPGKSGINFLTPLLFSVKKKIEGNTRPYFSYQASEIDSYFTASGFSHLATKKQFVVPMGIHRAVGKKGFSSPIESLCRSLGITALFGSPAIVCYRKS
mgnify:CR=1 FL=1